jgi:predicted MPP superfamily phosphohydrolase
MRGERLNITRVQLPGAFDLRIALVADLHGRDPAEVLRALEAEHPDAIVAAGDILETPRPENAPPEDEDWGLLHRLIHRVDTVFYRGRARRGSHENAMRLFAAAADIAPTFYTPGNHDQWLTREDRAQIMKTGAILLENAAASIRVRGNPVAFGGIVTRRGAGWARKFSRIPGARVLICHRPELYEPHLRELALPLILSGHTHGGQWRLFERGVFAPGQGLFPKYTKGVYDGRLVISAGLANTANVPRINNPLELVMVELRKEETA